jgi:hypothetical protein
MAARVIEETPPGDGQLRAAPVAMEQMGAQFDLQRPHLPAQRGLTHVELQCGIAETALFGDAHEILELQEFHCDLLWYAVYT